MRRYASPQWLYKSKVGVTGYGQEDLPASYFRNNLPYPFELHWIAITGIAARPKPGSFEDEAGIARTIRMNLALSSEGDINYIRTNGAALMAPTHAYRHHRARYAVGHCLRFTRGAGPQHPSSYPVVPADAGLEVSVRHPNLNDWAYKDYDYPSALFNGFILTAGDNGPRNPAHLAAVGPKDLQPNAIHNFDCADLQNDGKHDLHLVEMILNDVKEPELGGYGQGSLNVEWLVNPTTGVPWMPEREHMPLGNICPFNDPQFTGVNLMGGTGAWAYEFPPNTMLMPRQRMGIELRDLSGEKQEVNISLFGYLEVS